MFHLFIVKHQCIFHIFGSTQVKCVQHFAKYKKENYGVTQKNRQQTRKKFSFAIGQFCQTML